MAIGQNMILALSAEICVNRRRRLIEAEAKPWRFDALELFQWRFAHLAEVPHPEAQLDQHFFMRNGLVVFEPLSGFRHGHALLPR